MPIALAPRHERAVHLALPLGLVGFAGSWFVSDFYRLSLRGDEASARGVLTFVLPLVGALVGLVLSSRPVARRRWATWIAVAGATMCAGAAVGIATGACLAFRGEIPACALTGWATSLAFLPFVFLITWLARTAGRARLGSLVDDADRRAPWAVIASSVPIGRLLVASSPLAELSAHSHDHLRSVDSALALLACSGLTLLTLFDLVALGRASRARRALVDMTPRDPVAGLPCDDTEDMGLGEMEHEELFGGPAYRTAPRPLRVVRGSPFEAMRVLRRATITTAACAVFAWSATAAAIAAS